MKLRNLVLAVGISGLLAPVTLLAVDTESAPAATAPAEAEKVETTKADATRSDTTKVEVTKSEAGKTDTAAPKEKPKGGVHCDRATGSIMRSTVRNGCRASIGPMRTYTEEDLQRTGENDLNQALRKLDVAFR
jgi:hypothetical protein